MIKSSAAVSMSIVASRAKQLASDIETGALWPGQFEEAAREIREQLERANREYKS